MRGAFGLLVAIAISVTPAATLARPGDGAEFQEKCEKAAHGDAVIQVVIEHFIIGVVETGHNLSKIYKQPALSCFPEGYSLHDIGDVFCTYLKDHPQDRGVRASVLALTAFNRAFPCR